MEIAAPGACGNRGSGLLLNPDCARKMEALSTKTQRASSAVRTQSALCSMAVARSAGKRKKIADVVEEDTTLLTVDTTYKCLCADVEEEDC